MKKAKLTTIRNTGQQGDVLMRRLDKLPAGEVTVLAKGRCVVAHGESGHSHVIEDDQAELIQIGEQILVRLGRDVELKHEEHTVERYAAGIWATWPVREHDYFTNTNRPARD